MAHQMGSYPFVKYMTPQFLQLIKDQLDVEQLVLILTLITTTSRNGLKLENQKVMLIDNPLIYTSARLLVINLCESLKKEIQQLEESGANSCKKEKLLENLTSCLKEIQTRATPKHIRKTV